MINRIRVLKRYPGMARYGGLFIHLYIIAPTCVCTWPSTGLYLTLNWYEYFSLGATQNNCCPNTEGCAETTSPLVYIPELTGSELVCGVKTLLFSLIFCQPVCSPPPLPLLPSLPLPLSYPSSLLPSPFPAFPPLSLRSIPSLILVGLNLMIVLPLLRTSMELSWHFQLQSTSSPTIASRYVGLRKAYYVKISLLLCKSFSCEHPPQSSPPPTHTIPPTTHSPLPPSTHTHTHTHTHSWSSTHGPWKEVVGIFYPEMTKNWSLRWLYRILVYRAGELV